MTRDIRSRSKRRSWALCCRNALTEVFGWMWLVRVERDVSVIVTECLMERRPRIGQSVILFDPDFAFGLTYFISPFVKRPQLAAVPNSWSWGRGILHHGLPSLGSTLSGLKTLLGRVSARLVHDPELDRSIGPRRDDLVALTFLSPRADGCAR
jgi:hypothetical protein